MGNAKSHPTVAGESLVRLRYAMSALLFRGKGQMQTTRSSISMDVHTATVQIIIAEDGRIGPIQFVRVIPNAPEGEFKRRDLLAIGRKKVWRKLARVASLERSSGPN
jgi:hypothetical protein